jgi:hypothetical protein
MTLREALNRDVDFLKSYHNGDSPGVKCQLWFLIETSVLTICVLHHFETPNRLNRIELRLYE